MSDPSTPEGIPEKDIPELYQAVVSRRISYDTMLWQTPVLSLTAQAFLLTIAFGAGSESLARIVTGALALVTALASVQLISKHRAHEEADSEWLQAYEVKHFGLTVHRQERPYLKLRGMTYWSSFHIW